jgi:hypothetical protein
MSDAVADHRRGSAPCWIELVRADQALAVAVSRAGFQPFAAPVIPYADQKLVVGLQPLAARVAPKPPAPALAGSPPPPPAGSERFE